VEEFALRRAVGTPRSLPAGIVLAERMLTGLFTAAGAIGVSALALRVLSGLLESRTSDLTHLAFGWQAGRGGRHRRAGRRSAGRAHPGDPSGSHPDRDRHASRSFSSCADSRRIFR
jgi:hypothetical protein